MSSLHTHQIMYVSKFFHRYGMQNQFDPPRPAPNADGWSSGDDFLAWNDQNQEVQQSFGGPGGQQPGQQQQQNNQFRTPAQQRLQYNQQHYQQRQQQQQWTQAAQQAQWNISANEFVPK